MSEFFDALETRDPAQRESLYMGALPELVAHAQRAAPAFGELLAGVRQAVPGTRIEFAPDASPDLRNYRVSCARIVRALPAYRTHWTVAHGVEEVYQAIADIGLTSDHFEGPRYNRIAYLQQLLAAGRVRADLRWAGLRATAAE